MHLPHSVSRDSGTLISVVRLYDTRFSLSRNGHPSADARREPADDIRVFLDCSESAPTLSLNCFSLLAMKVWDNRF